MKAVVGSRGSRGSAIGGAVKAGSRYVSRAERAAVAPIAMWSSVSSSVIYSILHLWTKQTGRLEKKRGGGTFTLQQHQSSDCGHWAA